MAKGSRFVWHDLMTTDLEGSKRFYGELFGWQVKAMGEGPYWVVNVGDQGIGGMMPLGPEANMPSHWMGYIGVASVADAAARVTGAGGTLHKGKTEIPEVGWFAVAVDPQGAPFMLFEPKPGEEGPPEGARPPPFHF